MILIYSEYCKHCNVLLETIDKHDSNKIIKKISLDTFRNNNYNIHELIDSVPALIIDPKKIVKKDILFGKQVFDHLLLPNRGALFNKENNTRLNKEKKDQINDNNIIKNNDNDDNDGPYAFTLGSSLSDNFSSLDENSDNLLKDKQYNWHLLDNNIENDSNLSINPVSSTLDKDENKLPTLEEMMNKRNKEIF